MYPRISQTSVSNNSENYAEAGGGPVSAGGGGSKGSSAEGVALDVAKRPILKIIAAGDYDDCAMLCDLSAHPQMNVKVGVIENLEEKTNVRHSKGTLQVLDEEPIGGNIILVLQPKRLVMPSIYPELPWPCKPIVIMNHGE